MITATEAFNLIKNNKALSYLTENKASKIATYIELLFKFNKSKRLTSMSIPEVWISMHIEDSVLAYSHIKALNQDLLIDCGSGNGLPGIIFSILDPSQKISLVDTDSKKCEFLKTIKHRLSLENLEVFNLPISSIKSTGTNVPRRTIYIYRAFSPTKYMFENIRKHHKATHVAFSSNTQEYPGCEVRSIDYDLTRSGTRRLSFITGN